jgi:short-subunit dehydrogenase
MHIVRSLLRSLAAIPVLVMAGCATGLWHEEEQSIGGKTYVVTGASSGIGRGVALKLARLHANVVLAARRVDLLQEVAAQAAAAGGTALVMATDVSNPNDVQRLADASAARFGRVDVWINNAGVGAIGRFEDIPIADHARVVDVNLKGVIYGSHAALRLFKAQGHGVLVNIGSVESEVPLAYHASYAATKAAVLSLGRALNEELRLAGQRNISVSTVMPWATDTPFFEHAANYSGHSMRMIAMDDPEKVVDVILRATIYPREEVPVGWKARGAYWSHRIAPDVAERISANIEHKEQFEKGAPAPTTDGNLFQPMQSGRGVEGGVRARMEREDAARRQQPQPAQ